MSDSRIDQYLRYHRESAAAGDIDPSYAMLRYLCDRYELNTEQRYWLAWLYSMFYCGASAFYVYNEFPDFENVDVARMSRWWHERGGRDKVLAQTDRRWVRSSHQFVPAFESYREWLRGKTQADHFQWFTDTWADPKERYDMLYESASGLYSFGQFALFLYLEALHTVTPIDLMPTDLDLNKAWSCRNGLYYAYGRDDLVDDTATPIRPGSVLETASMWADLRNELNELETPPTVWQTETLLCAFRKWMRGKRYLGFYLDRQATEIAKLQDRVPDGVFWDVLWQYRRETYAPQWLVETDGHVDAGGLSREWREFVKSRTQRIMSTEET